MSKEKSLIYRQGIKLKNNGIRNTKYTKPNQNNVQYTIYKLTNKKTGLSYIGHTSDYIKRITQHLHGSSGSILLKEDMNGIDVSDIEYSILDRTTGLSKAKELESFYITEYKTLMPFGYNITIPCKSYYIKYFDKHR